MTVSLAGSALVTEGGMLTPVGSCGRCGLLVGLKHLKPVPYDAEWLEDELMNYCWLRVGMHRIVDFTIRPGTG